jgi:hypothetical protein
MIEEHVCAAVGSGLSASVASDRVKARLGRRSRGGVPGGEAAGAGALAWDDDDGDG